MGVRVGGGGRVGVGVDVAVGAGVAVGVDVGVDVGLTEVPVGEISEALKIVIGQKEPLRARIAKEVSKVSPGG